MKKYISRFLKSVAALFFVFPVVYIVLLATVFDIPVTSCTKILLSPFYYGVTLTVVAVGYGLWEMRRWSWYLLLISQFLVAYENALVLSTYAESHHKVLAYLLSLLLQWVLVYRIAQEVRVPYLFPKIRWWESNPRYRLSVPTVLKRKNGSQFQGEILDLALPGCFLRIRDQPGTEVPVAGGSGRGLGPDPRYGRDPLRPEERSFPSLDDISLDESVNLEFRVFETDFQCQGFVVWHAQSTVTHPRGVGIKFGYLNRNQKRSLRLVSRRLKKIAGFYRRYRYLMTQDEFTQHLEMIEQGNLKKSSSG